MKRLFALIAFLGATIFLTGCYTTFQLAIPPPDLVVVIEHKRHHPEYRRHRHWDGPRHDRRGDRDFDGSRRHDGHR
ncbi:hypothetical protein JW916_12095 [Candidatus Sumerlaeota bacterium]|nr:hypothetical protein [Candidatus Sumerlaeota bacterium]